MALFKPFKGSRASLDAQPLHDGYAYFCTDDGSFHIDFMDADGNLKRKQINAQDAQTLTGASLSTILNSSEIEIPTSKAVLDALDTKIDRSEIEYDDAIDLAVELELISPIASDDGSIYTDENGDVYSL